MRNSSALSTLSGLVAFVKRDRSRLMCAELREFGQPLTLHCESTGTANALRGERGLFISRHSAHEAMEDNQ